MNLPRPADRTPLRRRRYRRCALGLVVLMVVLSGFSLPAYALDAPALSSPAFEQQSHAAELDPAAEATLPLREILARAYKILFLLLAGFGQIALLAPKLVSGASKGAGSRR